MPEVALDDFCHASIAQMALTVAFVQVSFHFALLLQLVFDAEEWFPFATTRCWHGIGQAIGNELPSARRVEVRKVLRGIPAFETFFRLLGRQWLVPLTLGFD